MVESIVELLFGLFWGALILLVGSSIVGSIVAALRGVSHESDYGREDAAGLRHRGWSDRLGRPPPRYRLRKPNFPGKFTTAEEEYKNWRALCNVVLEGHDPKDLKHEDHIRHDSRGQQEQP